MIGNNSIMDLHNHTIWSDGENTPEELIQNAIKHGIDTIGITDHFNTTKCHSIQPEDLDAYIEELEILKNSYKNDIRVLIGLEICMLPYPYGFNTIPYDKLNRLDYVLIEYIEHLNHRISLAALEDYMKLIPVHKGLAHTDLFEFADKHLHEGSLDGVIDFIKRNNLFWEINVSYDYFEGIILNDKGMAVQNLLSKIKDKEIEVTVGSDSHTTDGYPLGMIQSANNMAQTLKLKVI